MVDEADHNFSAISVSLDSEDEPIVRDLPPKKYFPDASWKYKGKKIPKAFNFLL